MTHSDRPPPRKPRRFWLYAPYVGLLVVAAILSGAWLWMRQETERRIDAAAMALRASGWQVSWAQRRLYGYPFRLDVDVDGLRLAEPGGWAVSIPRLKSETRLFTPTQWLFAAPNGLTFARPNRGAVSVSARLLRASVSQLQAHPPTLAFEGDDVSFTPAPSAKPFWLAGAHVLQLYTRPGPADQGALYASVAGGSAASESAIAKLVGGPTIDLRLEAVISRVSALSGPGWRLALTHWAGAGGAIEIDDLDIAGRSTRLEAKNGALGVDPDGRLTGALPARLTAGPNTSDVPLGFDKGRARLGPLDLGPAPALF